MGNASAIRAGRAFIELFTKVDIDKGLNAASAKIKSWGSSLKHVGTKLTFLGAAVTAPIALAAKQIADLDTFAKRRDFKKQTGVAVSPDDVKAAKEFSVALGGIGAHLSLIAVKIASALAPVLKQFSEWLGRVAKPIGEWIDRNQSLVQTLFAVGAAIAVVGAGLILLGTTVSLFGSAISVVGSLAKLVLNPWVLGIAAIIGVLYALGTFDGVWDTMTKSIGGIGDALRNGKIEVAFAIVCKGMEIIWMQMLANMATRWTDVAISMTKPLVKLGLVDATAILGLSTISGPFREHVNMLKEQLDELNRKAALPATGGSTSKREFASLGEMARGTFNGMFASQELGGRRTLDQMLQGIREQIVILKAIKNDKRGLKMGL